MNQIQMAELASMVDSDNFSSDLCFIFLSLLY